MMRVDPTVKKSVTVTKRHSFLDSQDYLGKAGAKRHFVREFIVQRRVKRIPRNSQ